MSRVPEVVVAPNCLRGFATAAEVAEAVAAGVRRARPGAVVRLLPLADGGDGTLDALASLGSARRMSSVALDALGRPRPVRWLLLDPRTAVLESASICGLAALRGERLRPMYASSAGVGQVLVDALASGASTVLLGLGGTAVVDGGAGALAALGARFLDRDDSEVFPVPANLARIVRVDLEPVRRRLGGTRIRLLADVRSAASANVGTFGAQKGVTDRDRPELVAAMNRLVDLLTSAGAADARDRFDREWFGAGGAIGFGLASAATEVTASSGAAVLLDRLDPARHVDTARLVITGEGRVDDTTWLGKLPGEIVRRRRAHGLPTGVFGVRFAGTLPPRMVSAHPVASLPPGAVIEGEALRLGLAGAAEAACLAWLGSPAVAS